MICKECGTECSDKAEAAELVRLLKKLSPAEQAGFAMMVKGAAAIAACKKKTAI